MKVEFAPLNIPLARRLQTAAVLQWVLSFLLLGKDPARSRAPRSRPVYSVQGVSVSSLADSPCPRTRLDPPSSRVSQNKKVREGFGELTWDSWFFSPRAPRSEGLFGNCFPWDFFFFFSLMPTLPTVKVTDDNYAT